MQVSQSFNGIPEKYFTEQDKWELSLDELWRRTRGEMGLKLSQERLDWIMHLARNAMEQAERTAQAGDTPAGPPKAKKKEN